MAVVGPPTLFLRNRVAEQDKTGLMMKAFTRRPIKTSSHFIKGFVKKGEGWSLFLNGKQMINKWINPEKTLLYFAALSHLFLFI